MKHTWKNSARTVLGGTVAALVLYFALAVGYTGVNVRIDGPLVQSASTAVSQAPSISFDLAAPSVAHATNASDFLENKYVDYVFRAQAWTAPTVLCVALATAAPTDATTGATITEAGYTGYARGQLNPSASNWKGTGLETAGASAGTSGTVKNNAIITIGSAATSGPTVVTHFAILDSCTIGAGNILFWAALTASKTINNGDPAPSFAVDALTVQGDN